MPLDHFVPQVHIKNFYSEELGQLVRVIRKSDSKKFNARSQDICRIENNSSNAYLKEDRAVEEFLREIEPRYNRCIQALRTEEFSDEVIYVIAGFVAYVLTCSPGGMRTQSGPLKSAVEAVTFNLDARGEFGAPPEAFGGKSLTELMREGAVRVTIDEKYPQAMGISSLAYFVSLFGNSSWDVMINDGTQIPFFTSDFPVAVEFLNDNVPINRIVPLAPDLAIRIVPNLAKRGGKPDFSFPDFKFRVRKILAAEALELNRLIVRCAEDLVLYRDNLSWVERLVARNKSFRVIADTQQLPTERGYMNISTLRVAEV